MAVNTTDLPRSVHPAMRDQISRVPYLPGLDGLRAIAVLGVIVYHANHAWLGGGFLGVEVFFVISGYLITLLMVGEHERTGTVRLGQFWLRRARRLLPALYAMLAALAVYMTFFRRAPMGETRGDFVGGLLYASNWVQIVVGQSYTAAEAFAPLRHLWSLAVEEQFYLLWPLVMALLLRRRRGRVISTAPFMFAAALAIAVVTAVMFVGGPVFLGADPTGAVSCGAGESHGFISLFGRCINVNEMLYLNTFSRAGGLMLGAGFALIWRPLAIMRSPLRRRGMLVDVAAVAALIGLAVAMKVLFLFDPFEGIYDAWLFRGGFLFVGLCTLACIAAATHRRSRVGRLLGNPVLAWVGTRSYGLYLFHWPIFQIVRTPGEQLGVWSFLLAFAITLPVTELSYRCIELPVRQGRLGEWMRGQRVPRTPATRARRRRTVVMSTGLALVTAFAAVNVATAQRQCVGAVACDSEAGREAIAAGFATSTTAVEDPSSTTPAPSTPASTASPTSTSPLPGTSVPAGGATLPATTAPATTAPATTAPATTVPDPADLLPVYAIGESVMLGAAPQLREGGLQVNAAVSRQGANVAEVIGQLRAGGQLGRVVVIQSGTNGPVSDATYDKIMGFLPANLTPLVVFLTVRAKRGWINGNNDRIKGLPARYPNVRVIDWQALSEGIKGELARDGYHLRTPFAKQFYANLIFDAIGRPDLKK